MPKIYNYHTSSYVEVNEKYISKSLESNTQRFTKQNLKQMSKVISEYLISIIYYRRIDIKYFVLVYETWLIS